MTLPLLHALKTAPKKDKEHLLSLLHESPDTRKTSFLEARQIIDQAGGFAFAKQKAENLIHEATAALSTFLCLDHNRNFNFLAKNQVAIDV